MGCYVLYSMLLLQELGAYVDSRELVNRDQVLGEIQGLISRCEGRLDDSFQSVRSFVGAFRMFLRKSLKIISGIEL